MVNKCPFCGKEEEDLDYILIHCPRVWRQWTYFLSAFGFRWVYPLKVKDFLSNWSQLPISKKAKRVRRVVPLTPFQVFQKERNRITFEGASLSLNKIKIFVILLVFLVCEESPKYGYFFCQADFVLVSWLCPVVFLALVLHSSYFYLFVYHLYIIFSLNESVLFCLQKK